MHDTILQLSSQLHSKKISSVELTKFYLEQIAKLNQEINSFISYDVDRALQEANNADKLLASGQARKLTGIPIALKDIFCVKDTLTTCASKMLSNFIAPYNSTIAEKIFQENQMVLLGKTNMDEFAMGSSNENSFYGAVKNPWDKTRVPGGSSGGSAAAVAANMAPISLGTDTGGSIRQPASFCGLTGIKPTYGRVSRYGMIAYASSLDQAGVLAQNAEDAALLLEAICGFDAKDSTSVNLPAENFTSQLNQSLAGVKIGIPKQWFNSDLDSEIAKSIELALDVYKKFGAEIIEIDLAYTHLSIAAYYIIASSEASSNLSRFDGVRYGYRCENPRNLEDLYIRSRSEGFGAEVQRRILVGTYALSAGYYDAYYLQAQKIRRLIKNDFIAAFKQVDFIIGPVAPTTAFKIGEKVSDATAMYLADVFTLSLNLAGLPGMSVPVGLVNGLPVGMQIIANYWQEGKLLNIAKLLQKNSDWHLAKPNLSI